MFVDVVMGVLAVGWGLGASFFIATTPLRGKVGSASARKVAARRLYAERARPLTDTIAGSRSWYRAQRERNSGGVVNPSDALSG
jgi:hypothetical protein